jgi:hypothetical protein
MTDHPELFGEVPRPLRQYLPSFTHALVDLGVIDDSDLSAEIRLRAFLKALKYVFRPEVPGRIDLLLAEASSLDIADLVLILTYIGKGAAGISDDEMQDAVHRLLPDREEQVMTRFGQKHFDDGEAKGKAGALARLLEKRFGSIPGGVRETISAADLTSLDVWFDRAIDAPDLQSVFLLN